MKKFKLTSSANGKVFRSGLYSTAILAAAIVLAVLVNLLAGAIPSKYTEFDLSAAKMYTLGDSSRQLMQSLDQDVTVYYLCETGSEDAIVSKLLDHYADESSPFPLGIRKTTSIRLCVSVRCRECIHRQPDRGQRREQRGAGRR